MPGIKEAVLGLWYGWNEEEGGQKQKLDENWTRVGALTQIVVKSRVLTNAPGSPLNGDSYIPAAGSVSPWNGKDGYIAVYRSENLAWEFYQPKDGWQAVIKNEGTYGTLSTYMSGAWSPGLVLT